MYLFAQVGWDFFCLVGFGFGGGYLFVYCLAHTWLCIGLIFGAALGDLVAGLGGSYGVPNMENVSAVCKAGHSMCYTISLAPKLGVGMQIKGYCH